MSQEFVKTGLLGCRPDPTRTGLYSHRIELGACNFEFRKWRDYVILEAKTVRLISFAVTVKLICGFVFTYAKNCFSYKLAHMIIEDTNCACALILRLH